MNNKYTAPDAAKDVFKAVQDDDLNNLRFFLSDGASPDLRNEHSQTLLHVAILENNIKIARLLLDAGADADLHGGSAGYNALHFAAYKKNAEMTRLILEYTEQLERTDHQSMTPLQLAAFMGTKDVVAALAEAGADFRRKDAFGYTPAEIAQQRAGEEWSSAGQPFIDTSVYLVNLMRSVPPNHTVPGAKKEALAREEDQFARDMAELKKIAPDPSRFRLKNGGQGPMQGRPPRGGK